MRARLLLLLLLLARPAAAENRPIVAVFDVEGSDTGLEPRTLDALTEYLTARLAESSFQCIPRAELRARLQQEKAESYRNCVDQSCQIELGRELAAEKTLATKILRLGAGCQVTAVLFDLRTAATERAATQETACTEDALVLALRQVSDRLSGLAPPSAPPTAQPSAQPAAPQASAESQPFVTCRADDGTIGVLGWCSSGTFVGLVHLGIIVYAGTAADFGGVGQTAIINRTGGSFYGGVQGGLANFVGHDFYGLAEVSAVNVVGGSFTGVVQAGAYNQVGGSIGGIQAGAVNRADRVYGLQVGVLNFARELHGVQLGLLNFADNGLLGVLPILNLGF